MRIQLLSSAAMLAFLGWPGASLAQVCHAPLAPPAAAADRDASPHPAATSTPTAGHPAARGAWIELRGEAASAARRGHWEGVAVAAGWRSRRLAVRAMLPSYRIAEGYRRDAGLGDLSLEGSVALWIRRAVVVGGGVVLGAPTGDAGAGLGMGHAMIAPAMWTQLRGDRLELFASASLGHALGADPQHHHHAGVLAVNPMSPVEAGASLRLSAAVGGGWSPYLLGTAAVPLGAVGGRRAVVAGGVSWQPRPRWLLDGQLDVPVLGDPFALRAILGVTRWL